MPSPSVFGQLPGVTIGQRFIDREAVRQAGLHRHKQGGISGEYNEGADAIVVSGGYRDDQDHGTWILYTGQGGLDAAGRQVQDQTLTRGNQALALSEARGLPVRVIRGSKGDPAHSPASGYRYDGLYSVERHWSEPSNDGPLIFRYELRQLEPGGLWEMPTVGGTTSGGIVPPQGNPTPGRQASVVQRVVRNSAVTQYVKQLYDYTCQFCGVRLTVGAGAYAEGAHVRPVGGKHGGADGTDNVLCLCPNDHVLFDKGMLFVDDALLVREAASGRVRVSLALRHIVDRANFAYHRRFVAGLH